MCPDWCFKNEGRGFDSLAGWARRMYKRAGYNAKARGISFNLGQDEFVRLLQRSSGLCEVTGLAFEFSPVENGKRRPFRPSLDRIDASRGYTFDNCRIICTALNYAMSDWGLEPVMRIANALRERTAAATALPVSVGERGWTVRLYRPKNRKVVMATFKVRGKQYTRSTRTSDAAKAIAIAEQLALKIRHINFAGVGGNL